MPVKHCGYPLESSRASRLGKSEHSRSQNFRIALATIVLLLGTVAFSAVPLVAQTALPMPEVIFDSHHDVSAPLREMVPGPAMASGPVPSQGTAAQITPAGTVAATIGLNFDGISSTGWASPDVNVAVGATQVVQWVNTKFAVFNKSTGQKTYGPVQGDSLFSGFAGSCSTQNGGDGLVLYDQMAGRWIITQRATPKGGPYYQCIAVSTTSDATGTYYRYKFSLTSNFPDYPKIGIWPDAYYIAINQENSSNFAFVGGLACALNRSAMLAGTSATAQCFQPGTTAFSMLPSHLDGATLPPTGSVNYFLALTTNGLNRWEFHVDFNNPANSTFTGPTKISVTSFTEPCNGGGNCIPQPGSAPALFSLGDRLMYRLAYRNFGGHESLVVNHSIIDSQNSVGIRWYEIRSPGASSPTVYQSGTFAPDSTYRWMASVAMDKVGDMLLGYSAANPTLDPSIRYTGRLSTDALGTLESEANVISGSGTQTGANNWGDYTSMAIDPSDDCTFWYTNEYYKSTSSLSWSTRLTSFKFSACH
jgi:hypothetical protein